MLKAGDIVEWQGCSKVYQGTATIRENGELVIMMSNGKFFPLRDLRFSRSVRIVKRQNANG